MSDNKKYYYLKLKDNFYNTEDVKLLESMKNGYEYSSLYLKLCLLSLKGEGKLLYKNRIPYKPEMLSTITGHNIEVIEYAIPLFQQLEMLTILDNGTIFIDDMQNLIGHGSSEAERKAAYRKKIKDLKLLGHCPDNRPPEKEKEKEKEKSNSYNDDIKNLFGFWLSLDLSKHKESVVKSKIKKSHLNILKEFSIDEVKKMIADYAMVTRSDSYWYNHWWSFWDFIGRGYEKFLPELDPMKTFLINGKATEESREEKLERIRNL